MNPYQILEVSETASTDVIRAAWAALVRDCHPDSKTPNAKRTRTLNEAYASLKDPEKRKQVDQGLKLAQTAEKPRKNRAHRQENHVVPDISTMAAYPPAYPGFTDQDIDQALDEMTRKIVPPAFRKFVNVAHRAARGRA
jgi:curved DNA-binding protein CbpA